MKNYKKTLVLLLMLVISSIGYSNHIDDSQSRKVNIVSENNELKEILRKIKSQTGFDFVYNSQIIDDKIRISVVIRDANIDDALRACLKNQDISFNMENNIISLYRSSQGKDEPKYIEIKGRVLNKKKEPMVGVTVMIKGTQIGKSTDINGVFAINSPNKKDIELVFSFIGMKSQTYKLTDKYDNIIIIMEEDATTLGDAVVTGMEVIKREQMTGSASVITAKDLKMQGVTSIDRILEGKIAGLNSAAISGAPGTRSKITIRGENNLRGNTEPLWILDGLPMMSGVPKDNSGDYAGTIMQDGVGNIMPEDIESISILKDASAAAIYGARAANGVIVITTKKGYRSKTQINYSGTYEISLAPVNKLDFMSAKEKIWYEKSIIDNFGLNYTDWTGRGGFLYRRMLEGYILPEEYNKITQKMESYDTDWFDVLFRTAHSNSHNLSLRGGTEELNYYTSVSFVDNTGILRTNKYQRAGALVNIDYRPNKKLSFSLNISANTRKNVNHASAVDPFNYAIFANKYERPYNDDGSYSYDLSYLSNNYSTKTASGYKYNKFNILNELYNTRTTDTGLDADITFNIRYELMKGLILQSIMRKSLSYNTGMKEINENTYTSWVQESFAKTAYPQDAIMKSIYNNGELSESSGRNNSWSIRNQIDYSFSISESHLFSVLLANEVISRKFNNFGYTSPVYYNEYRITGVPTFDNSITYESLKPDIRDMFNTSDGQDRSVSFLGSIRYSYKDKYVLNFNYRADGADVIGSQTRFTPLWSIGGRYNIHREDFFKNDIISELSLRASYGYTGNIDRSAYPFSTISFGSNLYMGNIYANGMTFPNPTVGWERKEDKNFGIDMFLFDNRFAVTLDYYKNRTENILENLEIPYSTGRASVRANGGIVSNEGIELNLTMKWIQQNDIAFSTSFNISRNKNVIEKSLYTYDSYNEATKTSVMKGGVINIIGEETGGIYGWKTNGVNPNTGNPRYYLTEEARVLYASFIEGWDSYNQATKDKYKGVVSSFVNIPYYVDKIRDNGMSPEFFKASMQYLGRSNPKYVGGFSTYLRYKRFDFVTDWVFKVGHIIPNFNDYRNAPRNISESMAAYGYSSDLRVSATNRERKYLSYWQVQGDETNVPKFAAKGNDYWASIATDIKYASGNFLRLTNISLNYRLPSDMLKRLKLNSLSLGINVRNLLTFTKYRGLDVGTSGAFAYPLSRQFNIRLTVGI